MCCFPDYIELFGLSSEIIHRPVHLQPSSNSVFSNRAYAMKCNLDADHRNLVNVAGDGNCYFRCLSLWLFGSELYHKQLRFHVIKYIYDHKDDFLNLLPPNITMDEYVTQKYRTDGDSVTYATHVEIFATACILNQSVFVYSMYGNNLAWQEFKPINAVHNLSLSSYMTIANTGDHYMLIIPSDEECNCLRSPPSNNIGNIDHEPIVVDDSESDSELMDVDECVTSKIHDQYQERRIDKTEKHVSESNEDSILHNIQSDEHSHKVPTNLNVNQDQSSINHDHGLYCDKSLPFQKFNDEIKKGPTFSCESCKKFFYKTSVFQVQVKPKWQHLIIPLTDSNRITLCKPCKTSFEKCTIPASCILNNLQVADVPQELAILNIIEQRLVSKVHAYMKLVVLPYGQKAINGQVINFPYSIGR